MSPQTKTFSEFLDWLGEHSGSDVFKHDFKEMVPEEDQEFNKLKPAVLEILLNAEKDFFAALDKLQEKHSSLTTIEDIDKLTKDILKLCK